MDSRSSSIYLNFRGNSMDFDPYFVFSKQNDPFLIPFLFLFLLLLGWLGVSWTS